MSPLFPPQVLSWSLVSPVLWAKLPEQQARTAVNCTASMTHLGFGAIDLEEEKA